MQKLIRFWQNLRLRAKFLLILLVGIVPVGIVAIVTLYIPLRAYDRQLYKSSAQMISLFAEQIQDELMNFEDISYRILTDTALQENLSIMKEAAPGTLTWINAQTKVANRVAYYSLWFSNAVSFQLKTSRGNSYNHFFEVSAGSDGSPPLSTIGGVLSGLRKRGRKPVCFLYGKFVKCRIWTWTPWAAC